jgi:hypothetical protein
MNAEVSSSSEGSWSTASAPSFAATYGTVEDAHLSMIFNRICIFYSPAVASSMTSTNAVSFLTTIHGPLKSLNAQVQPSTKVTFGYSNNAATQVDDSRLHISVAA